MERDLKRLPGVQLIFANINSGNANFYVGLKALEERWNGEKELVASTCRPSKP